MVDLSMHVRKTCREKRLFYTYPTVEGDTLLGTSNVSWGLVGAIGSAIEDRRKDRQ